MPDVAIEQPKMNGILRQFPLQREVKSGPGVQQTIQAGVLQRFAFDAGVALRRSLTVDGELKVTREDAQALAQLVKAWDTAADRLRVLRGKGLPAAVRSKPAKSKVIQPLEPD